MRAAAPLGSLGEYDEELASNDGCRRLHDIECATDANGARKTSEFTFDEVKGLVFAGRRGRFLPSDDQQPRAEEDTDGFGRDAGHIDEHLDCAFGFAHVEGRSIFPGERAVLLLKRGCEIGEQLTDIVADFRRFVRDHKWKRNHALIISQSFVGRVLRTRSCGL